MYIYTYLGGEQQNATLQVDVLQIIKGIQDSDVRGSQDSRMNASALGRTLAWMFDAVGGGGGGGVSVERSERVAENERVR